MYAVYLYTFKGVTKILNAATFKFLFYNFSPSDVNQPRMCQANLIRIAQRHHELGAVILNNLDNPMLFVHTKIWEIMFSEL